MSIANPSLSGATEGPSAAKQSLIQIEFQKGLFQRRYKRFFADVEIEGRVEVVHVPNTGSMRSCIETPRPALVSKSPNPERKCPWTLEALQDPVSKAWVGVNTAWPSRLIKALFEHRRNLSGWETFSEIKMEVKISKETRLDGVLSPSDPAEPLRYFEIKNVTWAKEREGDSRTAFFPDSETVRGQKHLRELRTLVESGNEAELIFVIQRGDVSEFQIAAEIDSLYAELFDKAQKAGVKGRVVQVGVTERGFSLLSFSEIEQFGKK